MFLLPFRSAKRRCTMYEFFSWSLYDKIYKFVNFKIINRIYESKIIVVHFIDAGTQGSQKVHVEERANISDEDVMIVQQILLSFFECWCSFNGRCLFSSTGNSRRNFTEFASFKPNLLEETRTGVCGINFQGDTVFRYRWHDVSSWILQNVLWWQFYRTYHRTDQSLPYTRKLSKRTKRHVRTSTDKDEIEQLIGILLYMGIYPNLQYRMYWSTSTQISQIKRALKGGVSRFEFLKLFLHFNDNSKMPERNSANYDKL